MSIRNNENDRESEVQSDWDRFAKTAAIQTILYPFEYSKVLMQVSKAVKSIEIFIISA